MTMEKMLLKKWNPKRALKTNKELKNFKYDWYAIESLNNLPMRGNMIKIVANNSECRYLELAEDLFVVRVLRGTVCQKQIEKLGFERIPEDVLAMEFPA